MIFQTSNEILLNRDHEKQFEDRFDTMKWVIWLSTDMLHEQPQIDQFEIMKNVFWGDKSLKLALMSL